MYNFTREHWTPVRVMQEISTSSSKRSESPGNQALSSPVMIVKADGCGRSPLRVVLWGVASLCHLLPTAARAVLMFSEVLSTGSCTSAKNLKPNPSGNSPCPRNLIMG